MGSKQVGLEPPTTLDGKARERSDLWPELIIQMSKGTRSWVGVGKFLGFD